MSDIRNNKILHSRRVYFKRNRDIEVEFYTDANIRTYTHNIAVSLLYETARRTGLVIEARLPKRY